MAVANETYDVFISYARADGRHAADIDYILREKGLSPFFDRRNFAPGLPWLRALEQVIASAKAAIVLIGPRGLGNTQQYERDLALIRQTRDPAFPVVPVILPVPLPETRSDPPFDFLRVLSWIDFSHVARVSDAPDVLEQLLAAIHGREIAPAAREAICPYRGLDAYREEDSAFFFGRGSADDPKSPIGELIGKIREHPFVMVVGRSGSGKSSLVYAGLLPALRRERDRFWNVLSLRPGATPLRALAAAFNPRADNEGAAEYAQKVTNEANALKTGDPELLSHMIREELDRAEGKPDRLLLYIDQWEELYAQAPSSSDKERAAEHAGDVNRFIDLLLTAARTAPVTVVATVRADFYDPLISHQEMRSLLPTRQVLLGSMSRSELERTIVEPAKKVGLAFDPRSLVQNILDEAGADEGMLPLLQYALKETWALRKGNAMTADSYARSGGVREAIRITAERTFDSLSPEDQQAARQLFLRLVTPGEGQEDTRARAAMPPEPAQRRIVEQFAGPRTRLLVTGFDRAARPTVEVAHEALIRTWPRLRVWIDANREKLRARAAILQAKAEWEQHGRREDLLLPAGFQLERARALLSDPGDLTIDDVQDFIEHSLVREEHIARQRRFKRRRRWGIAVAAVLMGMAPVMVIKLEKARVERAKYETAAARGNDLLDKEDPTLALLLALEFLRQGGVYSHSIEVLAYKALQTPRPKAILSVAAQFPTATFSPDGRLLLIANENAFQVWDTNTITPVVDGYKPQGVNVNKRAIWSGDGRWIIGATDDNRTALFKPCSVPALRNYFQGCENENEDEVWLIGEAGAASWPSVLSPTGDRLLSGGVQAPQIWDIKPPLAQPTSLLRSGLDAQGPVNFGIAFNQQGDRFALGSADGSIRIHDTANPNERFILRPQTRCGEKSGEKPPPAQVFSMVFNPGKDKSDELAFATLDGCLRLWNVKENKLVKDHSLGGTGFFFFLSFDPSGERIAITSDDGLVRVWEAGNLDAPALVLRGHRRATWTVEFSRQTNLLASASPESVRIWTLKPVLHPSMLPTAPTRFGAVTFGSRFGALILHVGNWRDETLDDPRSAPDDVAAVAVSADRNRVLVAEKKKTIKLYDLGASDEPLATFEIPGVEWKAVGFLRNPDRMVGETTKGELYAWPFFKDPNALIEFAQENLPLDQNRKRIELSLPDKCRFGVETKSRPLAYGYYIERVMNALHLVGADRGSC
jgi:WD40 repeat protein